MNASTKVRIANHLTAVASIVAIIQTFLTSPPFTTDTVAIMSGVCTYIVLLATTWKQFLSPEINNAGGNITIGVAIAATLTGLLSFFDVITFNPDTAKWIKWGITVAVAVVNIYSKQLFPSPVQKDRMHDLKFK